MAEIRYDGRVAIVTGAGGGLGRSYALMLASRGAQIVVNDLGGAADGTGSGSTMADVVVGEIRAKGGEAVASYDSVASPEGGEAIVRTALEQFGKVDMVINNAGILRDKTFAKMPTEDLEIVLGVHLKGAFFVSRPAFRSMMKNRYGRLLFTASAAGLFGNFGQTNYGAAKMGLVGLSNVLALEGARYNITSNVIAPLAKTRLTEALLGPLGDALDPDQVTPLAAYLVSEECALTHEIFSAGGGRYARVFVGVTPGWVPGKGATPSIEEIRDQIDRIRDPQGYAIPASAIDELKLLQEAGKGD